MINDVYVNKKAGFIVAFDTKTSELVIRALHDQATEVRVHAQDGSLTRGDTLTFKFNNHCTPVILGKRDTVVINVGPYQK